MKVFRAEFTLEGFLIFSSEVRPRVTDGRAMGSYITPLPYIHNYPVMYGLMGKPAEAYFVVPSLHEMTYKGKQGLEYTSVKEMIEKFKRGEGDSFYAFPLVPIKVKTTSFLMSSESWTYVLPTRGRTKNVYPRLTTYTALAPESKLTSYIVTIGEPKLPGWIRIGKKRWGIMRVELEEIKDLKVEWVKDEVTDIPVNLRDVEDFGLKASSFSKILETPNLEEGPIGWAKLDECPVIKGKGIRLCLPLPKAWRS